MIDGVDDETSYRNRQHMVEDQLVARDVCDARVLEAMRAIPRHCFVPEEERRRAYADCPLPIGSGQTISQPYIVALMTQLLELQGDENVLEVGTGSGYQAAILGFLAHQVHTIERHPSLAHGAESVLRNLGYHNIQVHVGDGSLGLPEFAPYQAIIVTAAAPEVPKALLEQMDIGGRLVIPVGGPGAQFLERWRRLPSGYEHDSLVPVAFVPLRGQSGWREDTWDSFY